MIQPAGFSARTDLPRLGKKRPVHDPRTLLLPNYLKKPPQAPDSFSVAESVTAPWGMLANDRLGDCTCAGAAHMDMVWSAQVGQPVTFTDDQVIEFYNRVNGGSDDGAVELFVLDEWRKNGGPAGRKIYAYVQVPIANPDAAKSAAWLFSGLYLGVALPVSAQGQDVWDVTGNPNDPVTQPGSWGGHAINVVGYDADGVITVTWGALKRLTWAFWNKYVEEVWAVLPSEYETASDVPGDFDFKTLQEDLANIGSINPT